MTTAAPDSTTAAERDVPTSPSDDLRPGGQTGSLPSAGPSDARPGLAVAIVINPSKFDDVEDVRGRITDYCGARDSVTLRWYETTKEDPGAGQARQAVDDGAGLVCSLGGDGTVRAVASVLVDTGIPLGLLPAGSGNLLARNLDLPVDDLDAALAAALDGEDRAVDAGAVTWDDDEEQVFVVMAGMGVDGTMMRDASEPLKDAVGWPAYLLSGAKGLFDRGFAATVAAQPQARRGGGSGEARERARRARTVVVGNCGQLTGGLTLLPDARVDDGMLDIVLVAPRGIAGWLEVLAEVVTSRGRSRKAMRRMRGEAFDVSNDRPVEAELDGDAVGARRRMRTRALPGALLIRVPRSAQSD